MYKTVSNYGVVRRHLNRSEKKLLKAIVQSRDKEPMNITELCKKAKVSSKTWYRLMESPELRELLPQALDFILGQQLIPCIQVCVQRSLEGSAKHSELVFKLAGILESDAMKLVQVFSGKEVSENLGPAFLTTKQINHLLGTGGKNNDKLIGTEKTDSEGNPDQ